MIGLASFLGSAGWFTAFTLQISLYAFRERPSRTEVIGLGLLVVSIALVLNGSR